MAMQNSKNALHLVKAGALAIACAVAGCGDNGGSIPAASSSEARISGNVSDQTGPINEGRLQVTDKSGSVITSFDLQDSNHFELVIPSGTAYPIVITVTPSSPNAASTAPVKAVVTSDIADRQDVTAVTTIVVDSALALGGLTAENIAKASGGAIGLRQSAGVSAGAGGGGAGPGQSGGGTGRGGHAGHVMSEGGHASSSSATPPPHAEPIQP
ncbi:MAG: hypothetical protein PHT19_05520 [Methylococcus sp.]|nr:hypothetical protein [Methylococcus sp.]